MSSIFLAPPITLPSSHFLSLPPSYAGPSNSASTSSAQSNGLAPNTADLASADFEVDVRTGFLPGSKNVERLPASWEIWEEALDAARGIAAGDGLILGGARPKEVLWRKGIEAMIVVDTEDLQSSMGLMRRAHLVLSFLLHFYAHTSPSAASKPLSIPPSIAIPILQIAPKLGLPPILTYSDTVLYNFLPVRPETSVSLANPPQKALVTFTNTRSEEQFYVISAQCEIAGAEALKIMRQSLDELFIGDEVALRRLSGYLRKLAKQIDRVGDITLSMIQHIDPEEFYHLIRPWFKGGDDGPGSLGWAFMGVDDEDAEIVAAAENKTEGGEKKKGRLFSGPSAGQSSLIHAIDIFLTVDHSPRPEEESTTSSNESSFLQRMLQYMPLAHRTFLGHLAEHPTPLRPIITHYAETHPKLAAAYDLALDALKRFREKHMRIVSVFIVQQARRQPSERVKRLMGVEEEVEGAGDDQVVEAVVDLAEMRGTGGSPLFKFLKRCRDNTTRTMIAKPTGPVYELK